MLLEIISAFARPLRDLTPIFFYAGVWIALSAYVIVASLVSSLLLLICILLQDGIRWEWRWPQ